MADFRILNAADSALIVEFGSKIDRKISERILALAAAVEKARLPGVTEVLPTFRSLSVNYDPLVTTGRELEHRITGFVSDSGKVSGSRRLWDVPACYDPEFAPDIEAVARAAELTPAEVVTLHSETQYHVYMVGFVAGFPYMGDLPAKLRLPRRADPRTRVPPGSVAIATSMAAVYPYESPGGWHLIGTTPIRLFDPDSERGALLRPGDGVKFRPVSKSEFAKIRKAVEQRNYTPASKEIAV